MVDVERRKRTAQKQAVSYRNYRRARERALTRLAQAYPDEYKAYLQEEKARDEQTGKKWADITGSPIDTGLSDTNRYGKTGVSQTGASEGYNGGEA